MSRRVVITPAALDDITEIWVYIADDSVEIADRVEREIREAIRTLGAMPGKGHFRSDVGNPHLKFWKVYSYLIAYEFDDFEVRVARVISGYRDFGAIFKA